MIIILYERDDADADDDDDDATGRARTSFDFPLLHHHHHIFHRLLPLPASFISRVSTRFGHSGRVEAQKVRTDDTNA